MTAAIVVVFLLATLIAGLRARRDENAPGYLLAGRALTMPSFVATLVPTFYGGALGIGEFTWTSGLSNWTVMALPYYVFAALYALFLAERVRLTPGLSIPDHFEGAYGRPAALLAALLVFVLASPADEAVMAGALVSHLTGTSPAIGAALCLALAAALVWRGGLRADLAANRLQIVAMFGGFALILPAALKAVGGFDGLPALLPPGHLSWTGGLSVWKLLGWWLIAAWTLVDPAFHQRCAAAADPATARRGIFVSIGFWALFDLMTTAAGLSARALLPDLDAPLAAFPALAEALLPPLLRGLFFAGLAASVFAGLQATLLVAAASLGRDGWQRLRRDEGERGRSRAARAGIAGAVLLSLLLARLVPSVVGLWYSVGSATIPGLLLPMLGVYHAPLRVSGGWALASSLVGWGVSTAWAVAAARGETPLGLEPMLPGLAASALIWSAGLYASRAAQLAPSKTPQAPQ